MRKILNTMMISLIAISLFGCSNQKEIVNDENKYKDAHIINLNGDSATIDGLDIKEYDYTWNIDLSVVHEDVKDAPSEYYTGEKPTDETIYIDHELYYYPLLDESKFQLINYDGEKEYAYYYEDGTNNKYIFATLPYFNGQSIPTYMMHSANEAANNKVLHIKEAGTYILEGNWNGQIYIDLKDTEDYFTNPDAKVTVVLNGVDINCTVAPGIIFNNLYECDNTWKDKETYTNEIDTSLAGANIIIADDTNNTISGQNIYRMLKTKYKTEGTNVQSKVRKLDAPLYSYVSLNISGEEQGTGTLTVNSNFEGINSELHLSFNSGNIVINSKDDGININEDGVSVVSFLGGGITINSSLDNEGDGIDSNGFIIVDGSNLTINGVTSPDNALDSDIGITYLSGKIVIDGEEFKTDQTTLKEINGSNQGFGNRNNFNKGMGFEQNMPNNDFDFKEFKEKVNSLPDTTTYEEILQILGMNNHFGFKPEDNFNNK